MTETKASPEAQAFAAAWTKLRWQHAFRATTEGRSLAQDWVMASDLERLFDIHIATTRRDHHKNWPDCPRCVAVVNEDGEKEHENARLRAALLRISGPCSVPTACRELYRCAPCIAREALVQEPE